MDLNDVFIGLVEAVYALLLGIIVIIVTYKSFLKITHQIDEEKEISQNKNIALSITLSSTLVAISLILKNILYPTTMVLKKILFVPQFQFLLFLENFGFIILYLFLGLLFASGSIMLPAYIFSRLTKEIDELSELKNNNIAVAILLSGMIISIAFFVDEAVSAIVKNLIPYEYTGSIEQLK